MIDRDRLHEDVERALVSSEMARSRMLMARASLAVRTVRFGESRRRYLAAVDAQKALRRSASRGRSNGHA